MSPTPFLGNNDEVFKLADGSIWQVKYEYEYLYEYYPAVTICPSRGVLLIKGKSLHVLPLRATRQSPSANKTSGSPAGAIMITNRVRGCDYFIADGPQGYYIFEWYGGHDPEKGDTLVGYESGYGFKDVLYLSSGAAGRVYVDDYLLSRTRAIEKLAEKCE